MYLTLRKRELHDGLAISDILKSSAAVLLHVEKITGTVCGVLTYHIAPECTDKGCLDTFFLCCLTLRLVSQGPNNNVFFKWLT